MALLKVTLNGGWRLHAYRLSEDLEEEYPGRVFFSEFKLPPPTLCCCTLFTALKILCSKIFVYVNVTAPLPPSRPDNHTSCFIVNLPVPLPTSFFSSPLATLTSQRLQ